MTKELFDKACKLDSEINHLDMLISMLYQELTIPLAHCYLIGSIRKCLTTEGLFLWVLLRVPRSLILITRTVINKNTKIIERMVFYHGTTKENWKKIQDEGVLFGVREFAKNRATYLTTDIDEAKQYGEILLQVKYDPAKRSEMNNYTEGCWQCRVYEPIPIDAVKEI